MHPIVILFGLASAAFGFTLWQQKQRERRAAEGRPLPHGGDPGNAVDIDWLGDDVVVKVYYENNAYSAHVYWREEYVGQAGGFGDVAAAFGWGRTHARSLGADV